MIIYTEIFENGIVSRWYYGRDTDRNKANEIARKLGNSEDCFHCVCNEIDCKKLGIQNLPIDLR